MSNTLEFTTVVTVLEIAPRAGSDWYSVVAIPAGSTTAFRSSCRLQDAINIRPFTQIEARIRLTVKNGERGPWLSSLITPLSPPVDDSSDGE